MSFIVVLSFVTLQCFNVNIVTGGNIPEKKCDEYRNKFPKVSEVFDHNSEDAVLKEFPFMAIIVNSTDYYHNGILISEKFVLARSYDFVAKYVKLGNLDETKNETHSLHFGVSKEYRHPAFRKDLSIDLKLIMLNDSVQFNEFIQPACLPRAETTISHQLMEIGWGTTNIHHNKLLHKVKLDHIPNSMCQQKLKFIDHQEKLMAKIDGQTIFCAMTKEGDRNICNGYYGAALLNHNRNPSELNEVVGIAIYSKGCNNTHPTVFLRISSILNWIESTVWRDVDTTFISTPTTELPSITNNFLEQTPETIEEVHIPTISTTSTTELPPTTEYLFDQKIIVTSVVAITIILLISCAVVACVKLKRTRNHRDTNLNVQFRLIPEDDRVIV